MNCLLQVGTMESENCKRLFVLPGGRLALVTGGPEVPRNFSPGLFNGLLPEDQKRVASEMFPDDPVAQNLLVDAIEKCAVALTRFNELGKRSRRNRG